MEENASNSGESGWSVTLTKINPGREVLSHLPAYTEAIHDLIPLKRPVLLWSAVSLVYVYGELHVTAGVAMGVKIDGLTDGKLSLFFFLSTLYYTFRWAWGTWLQLRAYWRDYYFSHLWMNMSNSGANVTATIYLSEHEAEVVQRINENKKLQGMVGDLIAKRWWNQPVRLIEHFGVPFIFPLIVAACALLSLFFGKLF